MRTALPYRGVVLASAWVLASASAWGQQAPVAADEQAPLLSVGAYREALAEVAAALRAGDVDHAQQRARMLLSSRVAFGSETLSPDPSVLRPVVEARDAAAAQLETGRVAALARSLEGVAGEASKRPVPDSERLERLRREEAQKPIEKGGAIGSLPLRPLTVPERIMQTLRAIWDWLGDRLNRLWEWLRKFWPNSARRRPAAEGFALNLAVMALVAVVTALLAVLAYRALRRSRTAAGELASAPEATSGRDEDPLSREASEWERYAQELAAKGRRREAIRAWYHAVLVTLFRTGALHYHKGRTNWEYVSRLSPEAAWRSSFIDITRAFDREWYGRDTSTAETLRECAEGARRILRSLRGAQAAA